MPPSTLLLLLCRVASPKNPSSGVVPGGAECKRLTGARARAARCGPGPQRSSR